MHSVGSAKSLNTKRPPSTLFRQYDALLNEGFPARDLYKELHIRCVPLYDQEKQGLVDEWIKCRGTDNRIETELNIKNNRRLEFSLKQLERDWHTWRKAKYFQDLEDRKNPKKNAFRATMLLVFIVLGASILILGMDEIKRKVIPGVMQFIQEEVIKDICDCI